ncbi:MAG TPA: class I SAM-dependent methyltransferase [Pyrinomonadaceae bacterium]|nr:class I SAM-dependent methyltransferase [Pyrinomonadaceae bacterium]
MRDDALRPFYDEYAWAYDLIITPRVGAHCDFIVEALTHRGLPQGSRVLDAGCGAGGYSIELARRGYRVEGLDASPRLIAQARARASEEHLPVSFVVGDILSLAASSPYDAILCRGVLNDLLDGRSRREVFRSFARVLPGGGVLLLDVREWEETARRKRREPVFEKTVETARGRLTFRSVTRLEPRTRRLLVAEQHTLRDGEAETVTFYDFQMRCWTRAELDESLARAGFERVEYFGAYDFAVQDGATDRLVCVASRA